MCAMTSTPRPAPGSVDCERGVLERPPHRRRGARRHQRCRRAPGHVRLDRALRAGRGAAAKDAGGVRPPRPRDRRCADSPSAAQDRALRATRCSSCCARRRSRSPEPACTIKYGEVHVFLGRNFILTVRHGYATSFSQVRTRAESTPELLKQGPAFVLYAIMDFIVDQYFPIVDALGEELEALEQRVLHPAVQPPDHDADLQAQAGHDCVEARRGAGHRNVRAPAAIRG